jgi:ribonucleotide reductase alpha subunit
MPTASTAQILNNNESIEPYTSNIYVRKVLAGEYMIVNKHLVSDLKKFNLWNNQIISELLYDNGSIQKLNLPQEIKNKYKTAFELKQSVIVKQAIDRGLFIDQSQSMNLFMEMPDHNKLASAHIYAWKNGLKTGSYYIRSLPVTEATKFSIDIEQINSINNKRNSCNLNDNTCETCSA